MMQSEPPKCVNASRKWRECEEDTEVTLRFDRRLTEEEMDNLAAVVDTALAQE